MTITLANFITLVEKCAAYFGVGGVGAANVGGLPTPLRVATFLAGALAIIEDRRSAVGVLPPSPTSSTTAHTQPTPSGPTV